MTLLEVVAAIALLSTLLVVILSSHQGHVRQVKYTRARLSALQFADDLITQWMVDGKIPRVGSNHTEPSTSRFTWRIVSTPSLDANPLQLDLVRLDILDIALSGDRPLVSLHLFVPAAQNAS